MASIGLDETRPHVNGTDDELIERKEYLADLLTRHDQFAEELSELLEIEHELTLREGA